MLDYGTCIVSKSQTGSIVGRQEQEDRQEEGVSRSGELLQSIAIIERLQEGGGDNGSDGGVEDSDGGDRNVCVSDGGDSDGFDSNDGLSDGREIDVGVSDGGDSLRVMTVIAVTIIAMTVMAVSLMVVTVMALTVIII